MLLRLNSLLLRLQTAGRALPPAGQSLKIVRSAIADRSSPFFITGVASSKPGAWLAGMSVTSGQVAALRFNAAAPSTELDAFCAIAEPAGFGLGMAKVIDPLYRSALSISPSRVSISGWDISDHGQSILSDCHRYLAPSAWRIRASLSKVNVYRPGDFFKSHSDTPRLPDHAGERVFASLVVLLPVPFTGGDLLVRHKGREGFLTATKRAESTSDVDEASPTPNLPTLRWAAFYADCEHEVLPVAEGARVSITYDLFRTIEDSDVSNAPDSMSRALADTTAIIVKDEELAHQSTTALCATASTPHVHALADATPNVQSALRDLLADPRFLPLGGIALFHCEHRYPHTSAEFAGKASLLARALKGRDAIVLDAAKQCGLHALLLPMLSMGGYSPTGGWRKGVDSPYEEGMSYCPTTVSEDARDAAALMRNVTRYSARSNADTASIAIAVRELSKLGVDFGGHLTLNVLSELCPELTCEEEFDGSILGSVVQYLADDTDNPNVQVCRYFGPFVELNSPPPKYVSLLQGSGMVYGNEEPSPDYLYSTLALAVTIPPLADDGIGRQKTFTA